MLKPETFEDAMSLVRAYERRYDAHDATVASTFPCFPSHAQVLTCGKCHWLYTDNAGGTS